MEMIILLLLGVSLVLNIVSLVLLSKKQNKGEELEGALRNSRMEIVSGVTSSIGALSQSLRDASDAQFKAQQSELQKIATSTADALKHYDESTTKALGVYAEKLDTINKTLETRIKTLEEQNSKKLDEMRGVVDEKLQKTLESRIGESFKAVSERLEQVYRGLGEMQNLATGVGDLKKVLSNVKTRGILGEIQLGSILEEILSPDQYEMNVVTVEGTRNPVEYAIKLPGKEEGSRVYLPIDAKFPADAYLSLNDAIDAGDTEKIEEAKTLLKRRLKSFADDIKKKYVSPPETTDFAIMFLPTEGLYAEVVRLGMVEVLQRDYNVTIAGPTTMAALLNSLQMGFKTLAIQKRSGEVWNTLSAVKTEFGKFEEVLNLTQNKLDQATKELEKLVGTRTRMINRRLREITAMPEETVMNYFPVSEEQTESDI